MGLKGLFIIWGMDLTISTFVLFLLCCSWQCCLLQRRNMPQTYWLRYLLYIFGWALCLCSLIKKKGLTKFLPGLLLQIYSCDVFWDERFMLSIHLHNAHTMYISMFYVMKLQWISISYFLHFWFIQVYGPSLFGNIQYRLIFISQSLDGLV